MKPKDILAVTSHRDQHLPLGKWKYYQEWNRALFLHWKVGYDELRSWVPSNLQIDTMDGQAWVSVVAFTMEKIRPAHLPPFSPISNFHEINIRTYVSYKGTPGVYFLSIEGGEALVLCYSEESFSPALSILSNDAKRRKLPISEYSIFRRAKG
ncbi:DUF2071 domain-containing protein [Phaeocystidibacter marisrubri]|uniref:DUF2071 domain-containing protein n=1 Tax=Phaeocystidibacter marisrubri TaxID=1577780 RepID=UPI0021D15D02|nr:DUF2071 domain-containing protein [Phaeocystidibacter marisrubri]